MQPRRAFKLSFQAKVLAPVIAFLVLVPVVTLWVLQQRVSAQFQRDANRSLFTAEKIFRSSQEIRSRSLLTRFRNLSLEPRFQAIGQLMQEAGGLNDATEKTIKEFFGRIATESEDAPVLVVSDARGNSWSWCKDPAIDKEQFRDSVAAQAEAAMTRGPQVEPAVVGENLFNAVSVPIKVRDAIVAVMTIGVPVQEGALREIASQTSADIALVLGGNILSTLNVRNLRGSLAPALETLDKADPQALLIDNEHFYALSARMRAAGGGQFGYVLLSSYERQLRELQQTQTTLWFISLAGVLISAGIVWILVGRATEPLRRLRDTAEAVGRGDFSKRLHVGTHDELGALGQSFNRMSENLETSRAELEKTVDTLKTMQAQLVQSEKLSAVGEFVAGVAHELNNPLTSLIGFAELLQNGGVDPKQQQYLNYIVKSSQRCHKIVQSLLSFARQHAPERKLVKVSDLVESVLELLAYEMRTSNIEVLTKFDSAAPPIMGDSHQLQQVILNILNNGRQAIQANQPSGEIRLAIERAAGFVRIVISDNGPGISQENLAKIFDPFFTTKPVGQGTGLGLSLCYGIIKEHGGSLQAASQRGCGATFTIELPAAEPAAGAAPEPAANANEKSALGAGKRLLVVDDEDWILTLIRTTLQKDGYAVDVATDGQAALRAIETARYDLLLCDQKMPGLSGPQFFQRLQSAKPETAERVLFMTGDVVSENFQSFLKQTGRGCLPKPFSLVELRRTVADAISQQSASVEGQ